MGRFGFIPYVNERLAGIELRKSAGRESNWAQSREYLAFPEYYPWASQMPGSAGRTPPTQWVCTGPIAYQGREALQRDIANLKAALAAGAARRRLCRRCPRPMLAGWNTNEYYKTAEEFRIAHCRRAARGIPGDRRCRPRPADRRPPAGEPLHDAPRTRHSQCRDGRTPRVELLNHALAGIPSERVRYHTCYGINMGPRVHDLELKHIVDIMLRVKPAPIPSRPATRGTSTNGGSGKPSNCRKASC